MSGALSRHTAWSVPQNQPIPGREAEMVQNDAGGYVFRKDVWTRLADFLVLGCEGGTYYADEQRHTFRNIAAVAEAIQADGVRAVQVATEYSTARPARAPKNYPALYVVGVALVTGDVETRRAAAEAVPVVARTVDHLSHLFGYAKGVGGVGATGSVKSTVAHRAWVDWYRSADPDQIAYKILKAPQRKTGDGEPFRPGDLLRMAHPSPQSKNESALFALAVGKRAPIDVTGYFANAKAYYEAQRADTPAKAVKVIRAYHVPWEFLPTAVLAAPEVWRALIPHLGMTALIRNLARMTSLGVFKPLDDSVVDVCNRLRDPDQLRRARIHPFDVMLARAVYAGGRAQPNPKAPIRTWTPNQYIVSALDRAFELAGKSAERHSGKLVVALDKSGSMGYPVHHGGSVLGSAYHVSAASALSLLRTWDADSHALDFDSVCYPSALRSSMSLGEVLRLPHAGGATDLSAPIAWALRHKVRADAFVLFTDDETWAGKVHPTRTLAEYRRRINPHARVVVATVCANGHSIGDPADPGVLNIAGFDSNLPALVAGYVGVGGGAGG